MLLWFEERWEPVDNCHIVCIFIVWIEKLKNVVDYAHAQYKHANNNMKKTNFCYRGHMTSCQSQKQRLPSCLQLNPSPLVQEKKIMFNDAVQKVISYSLSVLNTFLFASFQRLAEALPPAFYPSEIPFRYSKISSLNRFLQHLQEAIHTPPNRISSPSKRRLPHQHHHSLL